MTNCVLPDKISPVIPQAEKGILRFKKESMPNFDSTACNKLFSKQ